MACRIVIVKYFPLTVEECVDSSTTCSSRTFISAYTNTTVSLHWPHSKDGFHNGYTISYWPEDDPEGKTNDPIPIYHQGSYASLEVTGLLPGTVYVFEIRVTDDEQLVGAVMQRTSENILLLFVKTL